MAFGSAAILLAYLTVQRLVELWWAKANAARLMASGGIEYGHSHLPLMILFHAAWLAGLWLSAYDRPVEPFFLALFIEPKHAHRSRRAIERIRSLHCAAEA